MKQWCAGSDPLKEELSGFSSFVLPHPPFHNFHSIPRMSDNENPVPQVAGQKRANALELGPRKKAYVTQYELQVNLPLHLALSRCFADPLVHHGRHFGRTVHAMCNFPTLLNNGILRMVDQATTLTTPTAEYVHTLSQK